jgi:hypothetical protein
MMGQDILQKMKNLEGVPFGLASVSNNWWEKNDHAMNLKNGFISDTDIIKDFKNMRVKMNGKRSPLLVNDAGELKTFSAKSRWNDEYNYGWVVGQRALDEVKGLRRVKHLILTVSPQKIEVLVPDWWVFGSQEYLAIVGNYLVSEFLRKYRAYRKKRGEPNNYICSVMEFQENGYAHFHLLFYGSWLADLEVLKSFWPYAEGQGVRLGKRIGHQDNGEVLARYLTKYISKDLRNITDKKKERIAAFLWFFRRRLYNMRHRVRNSDNKYTLGIGREHYQTPIKWKCYVSPLDDADRISDFITYQAWKKENRHRNDKEFKEWKKEFYGRVLKPLEHS